MLLRFVAGFRCEQGGIRKLLPSFPQLVEVITCHDTEMRKWNSTQPWTSCASATWSSFFDTSINIRSGRHKKSMTVAVDMVVPQRCRSFPGYQLDTLLRNTYF